MAFASGLETNLTNLEQFTDYNISIRLYITIGLGPLSEIIMATTKTDGMYGA